MGTFYNTTITRNGLVAYVDAANIKSYPGTGTVWNDLSGQTNTMTLINGVGYNSSNNGSLLFDGIDDYVTRTTVLDDPLDLKSQMSFDVWVYPVSGAGLYIFAKNVDGGYADQQFGCDFDSNRSRFVLAGDSTFQSTVNSVPFNTWTNISGTWNGTTQAIYINGALNAQRSFSTVPIFKPNLFVGFRAGGSSTHYFKGNISNLKFYNRALTSQEVLQNFTAVRSRYGI